MSEFDTTFPIICDIINNHEGWINSDEIARLLRQNPHAKRYVQKRIEKNPKQIDETEATVSMVAFFSQAYTIERNAANTGKINRHPTAPAAKKYEILDFEREDTKSGIRYRSTKASKLAK